MPDLDATPPEPDGNPAEPGPPPIGTRSDPAGKRIIDLVGSAVLLVVLSPLLALIALAVRGSSPGPVIFRQHRLGRGGRVFTVLKFRTMYVDAEARVLELAHLSGSSHPLFFKIRADPRVTPVGRTLRRLSLDELPQLVNILRGSMSFVGPRPLPGALELYAPEYRRRLAVKPGLTGLWQVSGRSALPVEEAVRLDLWYVDHCSLRLDATILARTVRAVLRQHGAW